MTQGTARFTETTNDGKLIVTVRYMPHGNFTRPEPRAFWSIAEARNWCAERGLRVVG
jgi:hypothetical protein